MLALGALHADKNLFAVVDGEIIEYRYRLILLRYCDNIVVAEKLVWRELRILNDRQL